MRSLYDALGVKKDADQAEIRKAFRTLARQYHPDVNKEPGAEARFKEVSTAYDVLGDEQKRALYDEFGEASMQSGFDADKARAWKNMGGGFGGMPGGARASRGGSPGGFGGFSFEDFFGFGGGGSARERGAPVRGRGADIEGRVRVPFLHALTGGQVGITVERPAACRACNGEGGTGRSACRACSGSGRRTVSQLGMQFAVACDECGGEGATYANECSACAGTGRIRERKPLNVTLPTGIESGQVMRLRGQGGEGRNGGPAGDLLVTVEVDDHPLLKRTGADLEMEVPITLAEAIGGATVEVPTPTGKLRVKVPAGSANGQRLRLAGKGVSTPSGAGNLYLVLRPVVPAGGRPDAAELAAKLDALGERDVRAGLVL